MVVGRNWKRHYNIQKKSITVKSRLFTFFVLLGQYSNEKQCKKEPDKRSSDDLADAVANSFFEARKIVLVEIELIDEHVQIATLITEIHANTGGIINNDECENSREGKGSGMDALKVGNTSQKGHHKAGVSAWHVTMGKGVFDVKSVLVGIEGKFDELSQNSDGDRNEKHEVGLYEFHRNMR